MRLAGIKQLVFFLLFLIDNGTENEDNGLRKIEQRVFCSMTPKEQMSAAANSLQSHGREDVVTVS